ncbi:hypothetical protein [Stutzerimonas sp. CQPMC-PStu]
MEFNAGKTVLDALMDASPGLEGDSAGLVSRLMADPTYNYNV